MEYKEYKTLVLERVPPGDKWSPIDSDLIFESLTDGLEHVYQKTKCRDYYLSAIDGKIFSVTKQKKEPEPERKFSLYGE